jgi:hypothetical protein
MTSRTLSLNSKGVLVEEVEGDLEEGTTVLLRDDLVQALCCGPLESAFALESHFQ